MREIKGFVCLVVPRDTFSTIELLFGKNMGNGQGHYESLESNDLTLFTNRREAQLARDELKQRKDFSEVSLVRIEINMAETLEEADSLRRRKNLIVVRKNPEFFNETLLIGRAIEERRRYPLYGSLLSDNGMLPFTEFESAEYTAKEEHRQAQCPSFIATFKIKRL